MKNRESMENYLETILVLGQRLGMVRSIDIANEMGFSRPSISNAMKQFRVNGYILVSEDGYITLTPSGREIAEQVYERHKLFTWYLMSLGVSEETARKDACRLEHAISQESFERMREHYQNSYLAEALDSEK